MTLPFTLPDWMPWWAALVVIVPVVLFALAFLFMPFSVFGVKGRLESVEARLDEIQGEIRSLALRLPERLERYERDPRAIEPSPRRWADDDRPPIPPAARPTRDDGDRLRRMAEFDVPPAPSRRPVRDEPDRAPPPRREVDYDAPPPIPPAPYGRPIEDRAPPSPDRRVDPARGGRAEPRFGPR